MEYIKWIILDGGEGGTMDSGGGDREGRPGKAKERKRVATVATPD